MLQSVHAEVTRRALGERVGRRALDVIVASNVRVDALVNQFGHDAFHFDNNAFEPARAYIDEQRALIRPALERGDAGTAWKAFGRLTHTAQDFYAHSNYVGLWLACQPNGMRPAAGEIDPLDDALVENPSLRSGKPYWPFGILSFVPGLSKVVMPFLPRDSHAWMNLDSAQSGPLFEYAFEAAVKRTKYEFDLTGNGLGTELLSLFMDMTSI